MEHKSLFSVLIVLSMSISACTLNFQPSPPSTPTVLFVVPTNPQPSLTPRPFPKVSPVVANTSTKPQPFITSASSTASVATSSTGTAPLPSNTVQPSLTPSLTATNTATNPPPATAVIIPIPTSFSINLANYIDDRSSPITLISSYFNSVNRKEYLRAYSYWTNPSASLGTLTAFTNGYADTASIDIVFGTITGSTGAGQIYYTVPVILKGTATNSQHGNYAACYVVHLSRPENFSNPPIQPMSIERGIAKGISLTTSDANALAGACTGSDFPISSPVTIAAPTLHIDAGNYLDNRGGPIETVSSYLNALNSKQYVRAYSYWQNAASAVGPYTQYANGFSDTAAVGVTFGTFSSDAGAGQLYYKVPLAMTVQTTASAIQIFVGCFTLHLAQPAAQGSYPFQPMGISSGKFVQYNSTADINSLLTTACQ